MSKRIREAPAKRCAEQLPMQSQTYLTIARRETGVNGVGAIGINNKGDLVFVPQVDDLDLTDTRTRFVDNPQVDGAFSSPIKLFFDPSKICPLGCPFCLAGVGNLRKEKATIPSLAKKQVQTINQQIIDAGILQVKIGGGEPFVYPHFWDTVEQLGKAGIALSTSTSGFNLLDKQQVTDDHIELLRRNRMKISISIDGDPQYHDSIRQQPGLFEDAIKGRERLLTLGYDKKKIELRATIINSPSSREQIDYLHELSQKLGARIRIRFAKPTGSAVSNEVAVIYPDAEYWKIFNHMRELAIQNPLLDFDEMVGFDSQTFLQAALDCGAGTRSAFVDSMGNFMPCGFIDEHFEVPSHSLIDDKGNTILGLWQTGKAFTDVRDFIKRENTQSECLSCGHVHACQGGCPSIRISAQTDKDPRCPVDKKIFVPISLTHEGRESIRFAHLTTGSILHYQPSPDSEDLIIFNAEQTKDGTIRIGTPGGKLNGEAGETFSQAFTREAREENDISPDQLAFYKPEISQHPSTHLLYEDPSLEITSIPNIDAYFGTHVPHALIVDNRKHTNTFGLIGAYEVRTTKKPLASEQGTIVFGIPKSKLGEVQKGHIPLSELQEYILSTNGDFSESSRCVFVGTASALVSGIIKPS